MGEEESVGEMKGLGERGCVRGRLSVGVGQSVSGSVGRSRSRTQRRDRG